MEKCDWGDHPHGWPRTRTLEDVLEVQLEPLGVPVVYKLPLGHGRHLATVPLGVQTTLDADARTLTIEQSGLATGREGE
jgi:muramoyltetrapeptide carboxypeptidase